MNQTLIDFLVSTVANVVGVFVGVWLALIVDNRKRIREERAREAEALRQFERALHALLGSVVKNLAEARRIDGRVGRRGAHRVIHEGLETSVWDATKDQFTQLCGSVEKRVIFAQFFNGVGRLQAFCEFHRALQLNLVEAASSEQPELSAIASDADAHLKDLAQELGFCGKLLIADHGQAVHQRLIGMKAATTPTGNPSA